MRPANLTPTHGANAERGAYLAGLDARTRSRFELVFMAVKADPTLDTVYRFIGKELQVRGEILHFFVKDQLGIDGALFDPEVEAEMDFIVLMQALGDE